MPGTGYRMKTGRTTKIFRQPTRTDCLAMARRNPIGLGTLAVLLMIGFFPKETSAQLLPDRSTKSRLQQLIEVQKEMDRFSHQLKKEKKSSVVDSGNPMLEIPAGDQGDPSSTAPEDNGRFAADAPDESLVGKDPTEPFRSLERHLPEGEPPKLPRYLPEMRPDARLNDVFFLNARTGWAAGDRGTVWWTVDGGRTWSPAHVPVSCPLYSIRFVDAENGIAVGGSVRPFTHSGNGVVLRTNDGGKTWYRIPDQILPILHRVEMVSISRGWAAGGTSPMHTGSLFITENTGRHWEAIADTLTCNWRAIDLLSPRLGAGVDQQGTVHTVRKTAREAKIPRLGWRQPSAIELFPPNVPGEPSPISGWMVGTGGLVMNTRDAGMSWQTPASPLPGRVSEVFDFHAVAARGQDVWIAGSPGTYIFHSPDGGRSWTPLATPVATPLRSLTFVDAQHGYAVGDLGIILATRDGGRHWEVAREGGRRLAVLGCYGRPEEVPLEVLVDLCGEKGYLGGVALLAAEESGETESAALPIDRRLHEAVVEAGACMAEGTRRFPIADRELDLPLEAVLERFDRRNDGEGLLQFRRYLVRTLRTWRPEVLLGSDPATRDGDALEILIARELLMAVQAAADPSCFPEQITEAGLDAWQVKKVHLALAEGVLGEINFEISTPAYRLESTPAALAAVARGRYRSHRKDVPETLGFTTAVDRQPPIGRKRDFLSGVVLQPGGGARRNLQAVSEQVCQRVEQQAKIRRNLQGILRFSTGGEERQGAVMMSRAGELIRGLDADSAADSLANMGWKCYLEGEWEAAKTAFEMIVSRYPGHPAKNEAMRWLMQYLAGSEAHWMQKQRNRYRMAGGARGEHGVVTASVKNARKNDLQSLFDEAAQYGKRLQRQDLRLYLDPEIRFPLSVVQRERGYPGDTKRFLLERSRRGDDAWARCAEAELWLLEPDKSALPLDQKQCPKPMLHAHYTPERPTLDGTFDDPAWRNGRPVSLDAGSLAPPRPPKEDFRIDPNVIPSSMNWSARRGIFRGQSADDARPPSLLPDTVRYHPPSNPTTPAPEENEAVRYRRPVKGEAIPGGLSEGVSEAFPSAETMLIGEPEGTFSRSDPYRTEVMIAYDHEFLYLAVRSGMTDASKMSDRDVPRPRDPDLSMQDRVEIRLDLDRDFLTGYHLTLDRRGWVRESCWGSASWNPTWYVAQAEVDGFSQIEAAIPLEEMTGDFPQSRTVWAISLTRIVPGSGFRSWADISGLEESPDRYGYLLFH